MNDPRFKCKDLPKYQIKDIAEMLLKKHLGDIVSITLPIEIDFILSEEGFILEFHDAMILEDKVFAQLSVDGKTIYSRKEDFWRDVPDWRRRNLRFAHGHELGHGIFHNDLVDALRESYEASNSPDPIDAFIHMNRSLIDKPQYDHFERQANYFAGNILVPEQLLQREFEKTISQYSLEEKIALANYNLEEIFSYSKKLFNEIADTFDVNPKCILVRLSQEGIWDDFCRKYE